MVTGPSLEAVQAIQNASTVSEQIGRLKKLKNDIVGHDQRKELVVKQGIVEPLVNILSSAVKATGKRKIGEVNGTTSTAVPSQPWTQDDEVRLQATLILGSLASGGPAFVQPLLAATVQRHLLDALSGETAPRLIIATLQAVKSLATSAALGGDTALLHLFDCTSMGVFQTLLRQPTYTSEARQQLRLIAEIISMSAKDDTARHCLVGTGLLDTLASLLASYAVDNRHFDYRGPTSLISQIPPSPHASLIPYIMSAITAIITGSNYRIQYFVLSTWIRDLFSHIATDNTDQRYVFGSRHGFQTSTENLLPPLLTPINKSVSFSPSVSSAFPALASLQPADRRSGLGFDSMHHGGDAEHANAVCAWLLFLARSMQGLSRLIALKLLALVNNAVEADSLVALPRSEWQQRANERERQLVMLAIPLAVRLLQAASEGKLSDSVIEERESQEVKEQACEVLALIIQSSPVLQAAAVDAGAIKRVCSLLKKSFDNVPIAKPMWSARSAAADSEQQERPASCRMGSRGLPPEILHAMRCRESALEAVAALAKKEDVYRKAIVEYGVVSCIIDSLKPFSPEFFTGELATRPGHQMTPKDGNTTPVILAACHAAQAMSRSVSLLRTSLIDAGIAKPVFDILKHTDPDIQIAATDVCCNLLLEFSPMREDLLQAGAIKTLTEHARQSEMSLRLASLWALKHLVLASSRDIKIQCLEELGTGWLVSAMQGEQREGSLLPTTGGVSIGSAGGLSTPNAAGEQVDLLNPSSMDVDDPADDGEGIDEDEDEDGEIMYDEASSTHYQASQLRSTLNLSSNGPSPAAHSTTFNSQTYLSSVRELEQNPNLQSRRDDVAVQEQALDFVRNLLNGEDCAYMCDHLMTQLGTSKIFALLSDKLAPVSTSPGSSNGRPLNGVGASSRPIYQPTPLILSTIHVLTHIANGSPKHKQLLIAQKALLQNWLPHFSHPEGRVRVICVWAVCSLTWIEDESDRAGAQGRVRELRAIGIEAAVRSLASDGDLDTRERVKTALRQIDAL